MVSYYQYFICPFYNRLTDKNNFTSVAQVFKTFSIIPYLIQCSLRKYEIIFTLWFYIDLPVFVCFVKNVMSESFEG